MLKGVQHDKKKYAIRNLFRNLEFGNDNDLIAIVFVSINAALKRGLDVLENPYSGTLTFYQFGFRHIAKITLGIIGCYP
jgi:hypothetical protein